MLRPSTILVFLLTVGAFSGFSQNNVRYGIHAGFNLSDLTGIDKPKHPERGYGLNGGAFLEIRGNDYLSAWFEINYSQRKASFEEQLKGIEQSLIKITESNDYVEIPFFFRIRKGDETLKAFFNFGGAVSLNTVKRRSGSAVVYGFPVPVAEYYNHKVNFFDYGFNAGGGLQIDAFYMEARTYLSLRNLYGGTDYREMRYITYSVKLGYEINHPYVFQSSFRKMSLRQKIKHQWHVWFK
jgi:hypothetical protein